MPYLKGPIHMRNPLLAAAVLAALVSASTSGAWLRPLFRQTPLADIPYGVSVALNLFDLAVLALAILLLARPRPGLARLAGLTAPIARPALFGALLFAPAFAIAFFAASPPAAFTPGDIVFGGVLFPLFEEIGYRGLALGALMTLCGWRFLPAALLPALVFGAAHFWQGRSPEEIAGVVAITGIGGLLFGWLFVRWDFNLWPPFFVHAGLNSLWTVFALGDNALGGLLGNGLRLGVVAAAVALTFVLAPRRPAA